MENNIFKKEFELIFGKSIFQNTIIYNKSMLGKISDTLIAKITWTYDRSPDIFSVLQVDIINRNVGKVDTIRFRFSDLWGKKKIDNDGMIYPHIWGSDWYRYTPSDDERSVLRRMVNDYIMLFL